MEWDAETRRWLEGRRLFVEAPEPLCHWLARSDTPSGVHASSVAPTEPLRSAVRRAYRAGTLIPTERGRDFLGQIYGL